MSFPHQMACLSPPSVPPAAIRPKLRVGRIDDPLEREANRAADAVLADRPVGAIGGGTTNTTQRKCDDCAEEETVRRNAAGGAGATAPGSVDAAQALTSGGAPLTNAQRAYFEPRFGADFSGVRLHSHPRAARGADGIGARAYALGPDIGFAAGELAPGSPRGDWLIAHELAHALQQQRGGAPVVRRASYGAGAPLPARGAAWSVVPEDERAHVDQALAIVDRVVADAATYRECHSQFQDRCPGGGAGTLASVWNRATIWRITGPHQDAYARAPVGGAQIGYTALGYGQSREGLASTLMHEAGHNCGIPGGDTHWHAELVSNYCIGPGRNELSIGSGPTLSGDLPMLLFSYRRFLGDWAGGRLRLTLGLDFNILGPTAAALGSNPAGADVPSAEIAIGVVGFNARLGGWGGSRYGGISARFETGFGAGQFALRPAAGDPTRRSTLAADWVLQVGPRAEFLIKAGDAQVLPLSVSAAFRLAQPINAEAQALQGFVFSVGGVF